MFVTRLISGIVLLALTAVFVSLGGIPLLVILAVISIAGFLELTRAVGIEREEKRLNLLETVGIIGIVSMYLCQIGFFLQKEAVDVVYLLAIMVFTIIGLLAVYVVRFPKYKAMQVVEVVFAFMYVPVILSFIGMTRALPEIGSKVVWMIWISAWGSDTCA